jgi:tryptophan-rich sensory protein
MSHDLTLEDQLCFSLYATAMAINRIYKPLQAHSTELLTTLCVVAFGVVVLVVRRKLVAGGVG